MPPEAFDLTLEQQFELSKMFCQLEHMSREQVIECANMLMKILMVKDNALKYFMGNELLKERPKL